MTSGIPIDELLSAYVDGEVSPDEQALVERAIEDDSEVRRLYEDLRALHQRFELLQEEHDVTVDYRDAILQRTRRLGVAPEQLETTTCRKDRVRTLTVQPLRTMMATIAISAAAVLMFMLTSNDRDGVPLETARATPEELSEERGNMSSRAKASDEKSGDQATIAAAKAVSVLSAADRFKKGEIEALTEAKDGQKSTAPRRDATSLEPAASVDSGAQTKRRFGPQQNEPTVGFRKQSLTESATRSGVAAPRPRALSKGTASSTVDRGQGAGRASSRSAMSRDLKPEAATSKAAPSGGGGAAEGGGGFGGGGGPDAFHSEVGGGADSAEAKPAELQRALRELTSTTPRFGLKWPASGWDWLSAKRKTVRRTGFVRAIDAAEAAKILSDDEGFLAFEVDLSTNGAQLSEAAITMERFTRLQSMRLSDTAFMLVEADAAEIQRLLGMLDVNQRQLVADDLVWRKLSSRFRTYREVDALSSSTPLFSETSLFRGPPAPNQLEYRGVAEKSQTRSKETVRGAPAPGQLAPTAPAPIAPAPPPTAQAPDSPGGQSGVAASGTRAAASATRSARGREDKSPVRRRLPSPEMKKLEQKGSRERQVVPAPELAPAESANVDAAIKSLPGRRVILIVLKSEPVQPGSSEPADTSGK